MGNVDCDVIHWYRQDYLHQVAGSGSQFECLAIQPGPAADSVHVVTGNEVLAATVFEHRVLTGVAQILGIGGIGRRIGI